MRTSLLVVPLALMASPVLAQAKPAPAAPPETITVPPELSDPATAEKLGRMMQAMSKAFLDLPVGEIEAAAEGRPATRADRRRTVRELGRRDDPNFERNFQRDLAQSRVAMQASMKAFVAALPAMMKGLTEAGRELEKATANMPSPTYPKR
jgi:hypothetical protein